MSRIVWSWPLPAVPRTNCRRSFLFAYRLILHARISTTNSSSCKRRQRRLGSRTDSERHLLDFCGRLLSVRAFFARDALSNILESKVVLGLARVPEERKPVEPLDEEQLIERAMDERRQRAKDEKMNARNVKRRLRPHGWSNAAKRWPTPAASC